MRSVACVVGLMVVMAISMAETTWPRLDRSADSTAVTPVVEQLRSRLTPAIRFALILVLGEYDERALASLRDSATKLMLDWYEHVLDPGVHGAVLPGRSMERLGSKTRSAS